MRVSSQFFPARTTTALMAAWLAGAAIWPCVTSANSGEVPSTAEYVISDLDPFEEPLVGPVLAGPLLRAKKTSDSATLPGMLPPHIYDPFDAAIPKKSVPKRINAKVSAATQQSTKSTKPAGPIRFEPLHGDPFEQYSRWAANGSAIRAAFQVEHPAPSESPAMSPEPISQTTEPAYESEPGGDWTPKPLDALTTNIALPDGELPQNQWTSARFETAVSVDVCSATRGWPEKKFMWVASCFCHNPLYFEEINLERYGYGCCEAIQPAVSACHFFASVPALPYEMAVDCPGECDYTLGHYRPGSCPPWRYHCCSRISCLGALSAGGVATGLIFLIP